MQEHKELSRCIHFTFILLQILTIYSKPYFYKYTNNRCSCITEKYHKFAQQNICINQLLDITVLVIVTRIYLYTVKLE